MNLIQPQMLLVLFLPVFIPVFTLTFLIGWRRSRGNPRFLRITVWATLTGIVCLVLAGGMLSATFLYLMGDRETDYSGKPLTVQEARNLRCPIPLPDSARNVQFVVASGGVQAMEILVRFEAPVNVCKAHVQTVFNAWTKQIGFSDTTVLLSGLKSVPLPEDHDMVGPAPWFDVEKVHYGFQADKITPNFSIHFWIDEHQGIFYCKITD